MRERSGSAMTRMMRSVLLTRMERPFEDSRSREIRPDAILELWMILRDSVSMMLIQPFDVPVIMWLPVREKIATQVDCLFSWPEIPESMSGVVGSLRFFGMGSVISTR